MDLPLTLSVEIDPREMDTEDLHRAVEVFRAELNRRAVDGSSVWRPRHFRMLLDRLGDCPQAAVLREAAYADDGYVPRERVLELLGRAPGRRLNGFRKRIDRTVTELSAAESGFPTNTVPGPLYVDYGTGVTALGFYVTAPDRHVLRAALDGGA